jgi:uncharacterized Fe-S cluster protein YjdI
MRVDMRAAMGGKYSRDDSRREALNVRETERQRMEESASMRAEEPHRVYRNERIAVHWNPSRCVHSERCMRGLPQVFQPDARPWVQVDEATADEIAAQASSRAGQRLSSRSLMVRSIFVGLRASSTRMVL